MWNPPQGTLCTTQNPQIYIKLTRFEDNDDRKLPLKCYLLRYLVFEKWVRQCYKNKFSMYNILTSTVILSDSPENITRWFFLFFSLKYSTSNEAETSTVKYLHSQWVVTQNFMCKRYQNPLVKGIRMVWQSDKNLGTSLKTFFKMNFKQWEYKDRFYSMCWKSNAPIMGTSTQWNKRFLKSFFTNPFSSQLAHNVL